MKFNLDALKKPWVKYSVIGVVGAGFVWIIYEHINSASAAASTTSTQTDPGLVALQEQANNIQASTASQASQQSYGLQLDAQQAAEALAENQLGSQTQITEQSNQIAGTESLATLQSNEQVALADINQQNVNASLQTQVTLQQAALNSVISVANINAGVQEYAAQTALQGQESNNQVQEALIGASGGGGGSGSNTASEIGAGAAAVAAFY